MTMGFTQNRELSWLNFNKRVLEIGADPQTPLFEKLKFVSIFQSNLAEFFMIRVGGLHDAGDLPRIRLHPFRAGDRRLPVDRRPHRRRRGMGRRENQIGTRPQGHPAIPDLPRGA